jgi:hypothetical protein
MNRDRADGAGGFFLALFMLDNMGIAYDRRVLFEQLQGFVSGDATAFGGPEEELAVVEQRRGTALAEHEREALIAALQARKELDRYVRDLAGEVLDASQRFGFNSALQTR